MLQIRLCICTTRQAKRVTAFPARDREVSMTAIRGTAEQMAEALRPALLPLLEDPEPLVEEFIAEFRELQGYESAIVGEIDLRESNHRAVEYLIRTLLHIPLPADLRDFPTQLGRRRARQGLAFSSLSRAVRLNFSVLWRHIMTRTSPADELFLSYSAEFWRTLDLYAEEVQLAYIDEANTRTRDRTNHRAELFALLITSGGTDPDAVRRLAGALQVDPGQSFRVVLPRPGRDGEVLRLGQALQRSGVRAIAQSLESTTILLIPVAGEHDLPGRGEIVAVDCVVSPLARGIAHLPSAIDVGLALVDARPAGGAGAYTLREGWPRVMVSGMGRIGELFADEVLRPLWALTEPDRATHIETAQRYLSTGSVIETARALFCHRNTVVNRLARIRDLTGYDLTNPRDAAGVILALEYRGWTP
jgi:hypothetical protein